MAAKFDVKLHINLATTGEQFSEIVMPLGASGTGLWGAKWNTGTSDYSLIKASSQAPIVIDDTTGIVLKFDIAGLTAGTPAGADLVVISQGGAIKKATVSDLLAGATDKKVAVDDAATGDYLGATDSTGALRVTGALSKTDGGDYITLSVADATTTVKGVASFDTNLFTVTAGAVTIKDATTTTKGVASFDTNDFTVTAGAVALKIGGALKWVTAPTSPTSTGEANSVAFDSNYFYICVATNSWKRTSFATWA